MSHIYTLRHTVGYGETDGNGFYRTASLMGAMQDAAGLDSARLGVSRDVLMREYGAFWMLMRLKLTLVRPVIAESGIELRTWHRGSVGALWYRDFDFLVNGEIIGHATTAWIVASWAERRILRPGHLPLLDNAEVHDPHGEELVRLRMPENMADALTREARYSDLDINRHVGNTKYADIICDAIRMERFDGFFISDFRINYLTECPAGASMRLSIGQDGKDEHIYYVAAHTESGAPCFESRAKLSAL